MADDELPFGEKVKTLQFASAGIRKDRVVVERVDSAGHRTKSTTEGDPATGTVTHTEHADSDRVDATVAPATVAMKMSVPAVTEAEAEAAQITITGPEER